MKYRSLTHIFYEVDLCVTLIHYPKYNISPSNSLDFGARNKSLTAKLLQQGYRYHKLRKTFSKFYRRHYELVSKFNVGLKTLLHRGLSEPEFYGDLVCGFKKVEGRVDFLISSEKLSFVTKVLDIT